MNAGEGDQEPVEISIPASSSVFVCPNLPPFQCLLPLAHSILHYSLPAPPPDEFWSTLVHSGRHY